MKPTKTFIKDRNKSGANVNDQDKDYENAFVQSGEINPIQILENLIESPSRKDSIARGTSVKKIES